MNQELESALKVISNNITDVPDEALSIFVNELDKWIDVMIHSKKSGWNKDRKIKKSLLECITKLTLACQKSTTACIIYAEKISVIFSKLLNPFNDGEIVQQCWVFQYQVIRELMKTGEVSASTWLKGMDFNKSFSAESEKLRVNVGSKGQPTQDLMHWMCLQLIRHINPVENPVYFYYWWQIISYKIIPFLLTKSFLDHRFAKSLSGIFLNFLNTHLSSQKDFSPFGTIDTITGKTSDPDMADKTAQFLNYSIELDPELAELALKCVNLLFPIKVINTIEEDIDKYPFGIHYEFAAYDIQLQDRAVTTIDILSSDKGTYNSTFYYLQKILFDLMNLIREKMDKLALRDHILLTRALISMRTKKLLESECQAGFIETISSLICLMEPVELFPQLLCIFLAVLYDSHIDFGTKVVNCAKSIRRKAEEINKKDTIKNILIEFAAHAGTALLRPLLGMTMVPFNFNMALKCPTLYANVHVIQKTYEDVSSDYQFLFLKSVPKKKDSQFNPDSILSILRAFDPIVGFSAIPSFAESLYSILSGVTADMPYDIYFLFDVLLSIVLKTGAKQPIDSMNVEHVTNIIMALFNSRFTTLKLKKKNSSLFVQFCLRFLCQKNIPCIFFGAIHALMEGVPGTTALIPLLMSSLNTYVFQDARLDQHPQILSFIATVISVTRNVKDFKLPDILNKVAGRDQYVDFSYEKIISPLILALVDINPPGFDPDFIMNGYDSFISTIFIDELLNGNPDENTWQISVLNSYISYLQKQTNPNNHDKSTPLVFFDLPLAFLMIDEELVEIAANKIPFIFDSFIKLINNILSPCESCKQYVETANQGRSPKNRLTPHCSIREAHVIFNFATLAVLKLPKTSNSQILVEYLKLFEPRTDLCNEIEDIKKMYRNSLYASIGKQCASAEFPSDIDFITLSMSSMLQLCMKFGHEGMDLYPSAPNGSAAYSVDIAFDGCGNFKDSRMRRGVPTTVIDAIGKNQGLLLLLEAAEEMCHYHFDAITLSNSESSKYSVQLAQSFAQRMSVDLTSVSVFFIPSDKVDQKKDLQHTFVNTKWEDTPRDFREFIASLGVFRSTKDIYGMHQKEWTHCVFSHSVRHQIVYHVAPLIARTHAVTQDAMQNVITIVWVDGETNETQKISGTNATIFVRRLPNGLMQGKTKINSGVPITLLAPPTFVLPVQTFSKVLEMSIKSISGQLRTRNVDDSFRINWESIQAN